MPWLSATFNFAAYLKNINKMGHYIGSKWEYSNFKKASGVNTLTYYSIATLPVTAQCNVVLDLKYDAGTTLCAAITSCNKANLNARYCRTEDMGIVCADTYHWGIFTIIFNNF